MTIWKALTELFSEPLPLPAKSTKSIGRPDRLQRMVLEHLPEAALGLPSAQILVAHLQAREILKLQADRIIRFEYLGIAVDDLFLEDVFTDQE